MDLFPAIDLRGGNVVRLLQGDYEKMTVYGDDPAAVARDFHCRGARNLHVVDLDGAKDGKLTNLPAVRAIVEAAPLFVEVGGGIRDEDRIRRYLDLGAGRVILGTVALRDPDFTAKMAQKYGDKLAVGVDAREGKVAVSGWLETSSRDSVDFVRELARMGVHTVIYTDISRDGAMQGTNLDIYRTLCAIGGVGIVASGGISAADELPRLAEAGCAGAIIGKAIYTGAIPLEAALAAVGGEQ